MNTLNILLPYYYIKKLVALDWYDIRYAIEQGFLSSESAIEYATEKLEHDENPIQAVIDLAFLEKGESIYPYIDELAGIKSEENEKEINEKLLYASLNWVYMQKNIYSDPLEAVEIIYADFDYPEIIVSFVRYMPSDEPALSTLEANLERLYNNWKRFLDSQKVRYAI